MTAFYNEIDPNAAAWLRELIARGLIAPGVVDERDIRDIRPADLHGFAQCHFFAGIGVWSYALRRAGWPDDRPVWTGSCPCQPFSAAGKGAGFADERHLWPSWFWLIEQCRPAVVFGEQVASKDAEPWIDLVQDDLEAVDYAVGAVPFPSAGIGAPHIRDRLYWAAERGVGQADAYDTRSQGRLVGGDSPAERLARQSSVVGRLADADLGIGEQGRALGGRRADRSDAQPRAGFSGSGEPGRLADADGGHASAERQQRGGEQRQQSQDGRAGRMAHSDSEQQRGLAGGQATAPRSAQGEVGLEDGQRHGDFDDRSRAADGPAGPTNGLWRDADWLLCRDGKWRPVEPGTFPLAHGAPARVGRLRGYGNAINAEAARVFIEAYLG